MSMTVKAEQRNQQSNNKGGMGLNKAKMPRGGVRIAHSVCNDVRR